MWTTIRRAIGSLELEERILNASTLASLVFLFFPWLSGQFLGGDPVSYSGMQFYVSYIGMMILILQIMILLLTFLPLLGGPVIVRRSQRDTFRLWLSIQVAVLTIASLSVLTRVTYEFRGLSIRYGVYISLVCSLIGLLYSFLQWQAGRLTASHDLFHHPEDQHRPVSTVHTSDLHAQTLPPPPPPPPPLQAEEHHLRIP